jgi:hypothetical protein
MPDPDPDRLRQFRQQQRAVQALRTAVFSLPDPTADADLLRRLREAEQALRQLQQQAPAPAAPPAGAEPARRGQLLGADTTGLDVRPKVNWEPLPTSIYNLLDPDADPLVTVTVKNTSPDRKPRRVLVRAFIEGLSDNATRSVEIERGKEVTLKLLPPLTPERAHTMTEVRRATLHVCAEDLDTRKVECYHTFHVTCLARNSSFNTVSRPDTQESVDFSHYYGAWVTPYAEPVQGLIRRAAALCEGGMIWGYQRGPDAVTQQVRALYQALKEAEITYVNSVIDYGAAPGQHTQRTRLPRESLALRSANCIDGSVLLASLLEGASLNAALVLVPGHALAGWETEDGSGEYRYLETTLIGGADFDAACASGQRQVAEFRDYYPDQLRIHRLADLRARKIYPME